MTHGTEAGPPTRRPWPSSRRRPGGFCAHNRRWRLRASAPPRLRASAPPRLRASAPPRLRASAPPRLRASAPPRLRASAPPRLRASAPPRLRAGGAEVRAGYSGTSRPCGGRTPVPVSAPGRGRGVETTRRTPSTEDGGSACARGDRSRGSRPRRRGGPLRPRAGEAGPGRSPGAHGPRSASRRRRPRRERLRHRPYETAFVPQVRNGAFPDAAPCRRVRPRRQRRARRRRPATDPRTHRPAGTAARHRPRAEANSPGSERAYDRDVTRSSQARTAPRARWTPSPPR